MLYASFVFLAISVVAGLFGFTGISTAAAGIAKGIFLLFLLLFIAALILALFVLA